MFFRAKNESDFGYLALPGPASDGPFSGQGKWYFALTSALARMCKQLSPGGFMAASTMFGSAVFRTEQTAIYVIAFSSFVFITTISFVLSGTKNLDVVGAPQSEIGTLFIYVLLVSISALLILICTILTCRPVVLPIVVLLSAFSRTKALVKSFEFDRYAALGAWRLFLFARRFGCFPHHVASPSV